MNKVILIGRLARDPEMRTTMSGMNVTKFTIAVTRTYQEQNGEKGADFINCIAWGKRAENIAKYCVKGSQVAIEGRIQTGSYDAQDGSKRYTTDIMCANVTFLSSKKDSAEYSAEECRENAEECSKNAEDPFQEFADEIELTDDMLPF